LLKNLDIILKVMSPYEPFAFRSSTALLEKADELGIELPFQDSVAPLFENVMIGLKKIPNRIKEAES